METAMEWLFVLLVAAASGIIGFALGVCAAFALGLYLMRLEKKGAG